MTALFPVGSLDDSPRVSVFACSPHVLRVGSTGPLLKYLYSAVIIVPLKMYVYRIRTWVVCITSGFIIGVNLICCFVYDSPTVKLKSSPNFPAIQYIFFHLVGCEQSKQVPEKRVICTMDNRARWTNYLYLRSKQLEPTA